LQRLLTFLPAAGFVCKTTGVSCVPEFAEQSATCSLAIAPTACRSEPFVVAEKRFSAKPPAFILER
jgi:hypothetical protein